MFHFVHMPCSTAFLCHVPLRSSAMFHRVPLPCSTTFLCHISPCSSAMFPHVPLPCSSVFHRVPPPCSSACVFPSASETWSENTNIRWRSDARVKRRTVTGIRGRRRRRRRQDSQSKADPLPCDRRVIRLKAHHGGPLATLLLLPGQSNES